MQDGILSRQQGFTLIELLIALFISVIVGVATIGFMTYSHKSHAVQDQVADAQQNARIATDQMARDIRMAGYRNRYFDTAFNLVAAFAFGPGLNGCAGCTAVTNPYGGNIANRKENTDAIRITYASPDIPPIPVDTPGLSCTANTLFICYSGAAPPFTVNDVILVTGDGGSTYVFVSNITLVGGGNCPVGTNRFQITFPPGQSEINDPNGICEVTPNPSINMTRSRVYYVYFNLADPSDPLNDTLMVKENTNNPVALAKNVEDLQVVYLLNDGTVVNNPTAANILNVRSVRMNLLTRTNNPDPLLGGVRPALEDHAGAADAATGGYRRRLLQEEVVIRNQLGPPPS